MVGLMIFLLNAGIHVIYVAAQASGIDLTNSLPLNGGPVLYYNGSGPVPPYSTEGPAPPELGSYSSAEIEDQIFRELLSIRTTNSLAADNCTKCIATHELLHITAHTQPASLVTNLLVRSCQSGGWMPRLRNAAKSCEQQFSDKGNMGPFWALMLSKMSVASGDMQILCAYQFGACKPPQTILIDESQWFSPKPEKQNKVPPPSGKSFKAIHITDSHLDERYAIGSEANCSQYMCCRSYSTNTKMATTASNASLPASRFGHTKCDPPADLLLSTFLDMPKFINMSEVNFAIFTGDVVSHDDDDQLSREFVAYEEEVTYQTMKAHLGNIPVYATLGNHDTLPQAYEMQSDLLPGGSPMSWNHQLVASLWRDNQWIGGEASQYAAAHYAAYATTTKSGLKIIALNSDFWYIDNVFNYINYTNPDTSGILRFLIGELEASEASGQRVWIIGHVPTGYDYFSPLPNPTALFYSIVRRFSPATIAGIFFGHTHQDQVNLYYDFKASSLVNNSSSLRNTSDVDYSRPINVAYLAPSISPLTGYNAGWRVYDVDAETFDILDHTTYIADVSASSTWTTAPVWEREYSARAVYDAKDTTTPTWPDTAPLNATYWDNVAGRLLTDLPLANKYAMLESKSSRTTKPCNTTACAQSKVCSMRSASGALLIKCPGVEKYLFDGPLGGTR